MSLLLLFRPAGAGAPPPAAEITITLDPSVSHQIAFLANLLREGAVVASGLKVTDGSVNVDSLSAVRRTISATIVDETGTLVPLTAIDPLTPFGNELQVYRGVTGDLRSLGIFPLESVTLEDSGPFTFAVEGFDRSKPIREARFEAPYTVAGGTLITDAIQTIILNRSPLPDILAFAFAQSTATVPTLLVIDEESDPWDECQKLADSIGMELFFSADGVCTLRVPPDPNIDPPIYNYIEGDTASHIAVKRVLDGKAYNKWVVIGETPDGGTPVRAEATDDNPLSPTQYGGPYGKRATFFRSQMVATTAQAQQAADAMKSKEVGLSEQVSFTAVPDPRLEANDIVYIKRTRIGVDDVTAIVSFSIPLGMGEMPVVTRRRRLAS